MHAPDAQLGGGVARRLSDPSDRSRTLSLDQREELSFSKTGKTFRDVDWSCHLDRGELNPCITLLARNG